MCDTLNERSRLQRVIAIPPRPLPFYYRLAWQSFNRQARLTV